MGKEWSFFQMPKGGDVGGPVGISGLRNERVGRWSFQTNNG